MLCVQRAAAKPMTSVRPEGSPQREWGGSQFLAKLGALFPRHCPLTLSQQNVGDKRIEQDEQVHELDQSMIQEEAPQELVWEALRVRWRKLRSYGHFEVERVCTSNTISIYLLLCTWHWLPLCTNPTMTTATAMHLCLSLFSLDVSDSNR